MGEVIQLRDFQNPKDIARMYSEVSLEAQANAIFAEAFPGVWPEFSQAQSFHGGSTVVDKEPA
jgi:hypothetical protein